MAFWDRYEKLCLENGYKPGSEQAAQVLGTNRGTISAWKKSGNPPTPDILTELQTVVFGHPLQYAFKNHAFRAFSHVLCDILHPDAVFFAPVFVERDFLPVASEPVHLPDDDYRELFCRAV